MDISFAFHLFAITQGVAILAILQIFLSNNIAKTHKELVAVIAALLMISFAPIVTFYDEANIGISISLVLCGFLSIGPALWFLINKLTATSPHLSFATISKHLVLPLLALCVSIWIMVLSREQHSALFLSEEIPQGPLADTLLPVVFLLLLTSLIQATCYCWMISRRLIHYRKTLRHLFSNTEKRDLRWVNWLGLTLLCSWLILTLSWLLMFSEHQFLTMEMGGLINLIVLLVIVLNGQRQEPAFESLATQSQGLEQPEIEQLICEEENASISGKYANSALSEADLQRYWQRIEDWMNTQNSYLDPDLTMPGLAKQVGISPWYISQTLSEASSTNFYEYINQKRVLYASDKLKRSTDSVLDIAFEAGFNSRSAFYNAFKKQMRVTPGQYRSQLKKDSEGAAHE